MALTTVGSTRRALVLLAAAGLIALATPPAHASPIVVLDTLGTATTGATFSVFGSTGQGVFSEQSVGPQFTLTERTAITEIGGFVNVCEAIIGGVPQCPSTSPFVAEVRASVNGVPDPSTVLGSFTLSHDDDPLVFSYESAAPNLTLEPGVYFALFAAQAGGGIWLRSSDSTYFALTTTVGFLNTSTAVSSVAQHQGAARILGEVFVPTSKDECSKDGWKAFSDPQLQERRRLRLVHRDAR